MDENSFYILFVDDDPSMLDILSVLAEKQGFSSLLCQSVEKALTLIDSHHKQIVMIISDLNMPGQNGVQFKENIKKNYNKIPFFLVSGYLDNKIRKIANDLGVTEVFDKPFSASDFNKIVQKYAIKYREKLEEEAFLKRVFIDEATGILEELEPLILSLENTQDKDTLNKIFRMIHTIKGSSGVLDVSYVKEYLHKYEDILAKIKNDQIQINNEVINVLFKGYDVASNMIESLSADKPKQYNVTELVKVFDRDFNLTESKRGSTGSKVNAEVNHATKDQGDKTQSSTISIPTDILDSLLENSGEITVIRNMINKLVLNISKTVPGNQNITMLSSLLDEMHKINSITQNKISDLRKFPIKKILRSIPRTVRDTARALKKEVKLELADNALRVDNEIGQVLSESLIHIIRNAVDHGMETPEERTKKGKPEKGRVSIDCTEDSDFVTIKISDDGKGIDSEFIARKALEKGITTEEQLKQMTKEQIFEFIFHSGFSTAEKVTDVSGRGVGMDMVKNSVEDKGGFISIESDIDIGTTFVIALPIPKSVIIISSLLIEVSSHIFAIPQDQIVRILQISRENFTKNIKQVSESNVLSYQGEIIPIIDLSKTLNFQEYDLDRNDIQIIIIKVEQDQFALLVDSIVDSEEIVVKEVPLLKSMPVYLGATFTGEGNVALILNSEGIVLKNKLQIEKVSAKNKFSKIRLDALKSNLEKEIIQFEVGSKNPFGLYLRDIFRLEVIPTSTIQYIKSMRTILYRDSIMPLYFLSEVLCNVPYVISKEMHELDTIVIEQKQGYLGFVVHSISDLVRIEDNIKNNFRSSRLYKGSLEINNRLTTIIDIEELKQKLQSTTFTHTSIDEPMELTGT